MFVCRQLFRDDVSILWWCQCCACCSLSDSCSARFSKGLVKLFLLFFLALSRLGMHVDPQPTGFTLWTSNPCVPMSTAVSAHDLQFAIKCQKKEQCLRYYSVLCGSKPRNFRSYMPYNATEKPVLSFVCTSCCNAVFPTLHWDSRMI